MKIGSPDNSANLAALQGERKATTDRTAAGKTGAASATVQLSATATSLMDSQNNDGSFDAAKVERIAQAIRDGKFQVNADKIADKLIANAKEVLTRYNA